MGENGKETMSEADNVLEEKVARLECERMLVLKLASAGAKDIETAVLVGMSRLERADEKDVTAVVEAMKKDKGYLFGDEPVGRVRQMPRLTGGARDRKQDGQSRLEHAAQRAARSGSRTDLQEYLRLRRNI